MVKQRQSPSNAAAQEEWSPRRRGCSVFRRQVGIDAEVVPAQAGVFRRSSWPPATCRRGPRAGGGVPVRTATVTGSVPWSPRRRGCSGPDDGRRPVPGVVPAQAGVFRSASTRAWSAWSGPRAGGGVPTITGGTINGAEWSPRRRGCSALGRRPPASSRVVPAQAGVFRPSPYFSMTNTGGPRAGGGVPDCEAQLVCLDTWSPRRRGCSAINGTSRRNGRVVPAQAGVFRQRPRTATSRPGGPRAGGGVPAIATAVAPVRTWSPRRRGCSEGVPGAEEPPPVVPAQAGVFRRYAKASRPRPRGPRAGGGVPATS